ncbi:MAG: DUF4126 domain-containing protein [Candidatus Korobacteraceae bacterium]
MGFSNGEIVAMMAGASFAAGLNVYATVATLALLGHYQVVDLPPALHALDNWWVIGACVALFLVEFVADKIPLFDLVWNALHTFVRVPVAAVLTYAATTSLSPGGQLASTLAASLIAFAAHSGKITARAAVTPSPEPVSNTLLSLAEDGVAIGTTWLATAYPYVALTIVILGIVGLLLMVRMVIRAMKRLFAGAGRALGQS